MKGLAYWLDDGRMTLCSRRRSNSPFAAVGRSPARRGGRANASVPMVVDRPVSDPGQLRKWDGELDGLGENIGICVAEGATS